MMMQYIVNTKDDGDAGRLMLRATADTDGLIVAKIPKGSIVTQSSVLVPHDGWTGVTWNGYSGYVSTAFLKVYDGGDNSSAPNGGGSTPFTPVVNPTATTTTDGGEEKKGTSGILIAGIVIAAAGALMRLFL